MRPCVFVCVCAYAYDGAYRRARYLNINIIFVNFRWRAYRVDVHAVNDLLLNGGTCCAFTAYTAQCTGSHASDHARPKILYCLDVWFCLKSEPIRWSMANRMCALYSSILSCFIDTTILMFLAIWHIIAVCMISDNIRSTAQATTAGIDVTLKHDVKRNRRTLRMPQ